MLRAPHATCTSSSGSVGNPSTPSLIFGAGMTEVRRATAEDASRLARMLHDFNQEFGDPSPGTEVIERRVRAFIEDERKTYLLDDERLGFAQVSFSPSVWSDGPVGLLEELYVVPGRRGEGIGRALM